MKANDGRYKNILHVAWKLLYAQGQFTPAGILLITIAGIALAEVMAMVIVYYFRQWPYTWQVFLDATTMTVIVFPMLYFLSFKPLLLQIQKQQQSESILSTRLRLMQYANEHSVDELLQFTLDEIETLIGSSIGFFHFLEAGENVIWLQAWSSNTLQHMCKAEGKGSHYNVDQAGVWADAVRQRQPVIHNNYAALTHRKGMPEGHALVARELVVPVLRDSRVVAIIGTGNKAQDFTLSDIERVSAIADFAWDIVENKRGEFALRQSEEKFRTMTDWTYDWEKWLDPQGNIIYTSPSCERITGYTPQEFIADPKLLARIVHPDDRQLYQQHLKIIHDPTAAPAMVEYRVIARDGSQHWIEHACRPLFGLDERYLGRRVSNREITGRKQAEKALNEQIQKEAQLTQAIQTIQRDIARDLHDTLGQNISFLRMGLEHLSAANLGDQKSQQIKNMTKAADESYGLIRAMLAILQADESANPLSPFTRYANQIAERASFQLELTSQGQPTQLHPDQIRHLFYIFREALSNIEKYAQASHVKAQFLWEQHALRLSISDDGCGFDPHTDQNPGHYGLKFMHERAGLLKGLLSVASAPGQGATVTVLVPYSESSSAAQ